MENSNKPLSEALSGISQVDINPEVKEEVKEVKPKKSKSFLIIVSILLLLIIGVGGYYIYTQYFGNTDEVEQVDTLEEDVNTDEEVDEEVEEDIVAEEENEGYVMKNKGWALFSLPEYGFSAEIPSYTMTEQIDNTYIYWDWDASISYSESDRLPDHIVTVLLDFYPKPDNVFACGGGCAKEHYVSIDIYENKDSKSLTEIKEDYFASLIEIGEFSGFTPTITEKVEQKWGHEVVAYDQTVPVDFGFLDGYLLVKPDLIYNVIYYINSSPAESVEVAQKVLDSLAFDKYMNPRSL